MITRKEFLSMVLPPLLAGEHYCSWGNKKHNDKELVRQKFATSVDELSDQADELQANGFNAFFGLAKFGPTQNGRYATNAISLKSFFIDLDCGPSKPYPTLDDGLEALKNFCKVTKLPKPTILQSGRGAHVYWILEEPIAKKQWKGHAERLKELCNEHKFDIDRAVPADAARVLRMLGSNHIKDPSNPIPVVALYVAPLIPNNKIIELLPPIEDVLGSLGKIDYKNITDPTTLALMGTTQSRFKTILLKSLEGKGCAQILNIYTNQETLTEPLWRAGLSVAHQCIDRDKAIHLMSNKYPEYSWEATEKKATENTKGPLTCAAFKQLNPSGCEGCKQKISGPIQLGREFVEASEADNVVDAVEKQTQEVKTYVIPKFPFPFFRGKTGGVFIHTKDKDGNDIDDLVYQYDFYIVKRMKDPDLGETILLRLHLPKDGVSDFIMPLSSVVSKERFINTIAQHGITVLGKKQDSLMLYVTKWVEELQMQSKAEQAHKQFGWLQDESGIIIGDKEVRATEIAYSPPSTPTLPHIPLFQTKGDFHTWKDIINIYKEPGQEDRAFAFFMGFGTLLMKFTMLDGFLLNLVSKNSGSGKTTTLWTINSIYGRPKEFLLSPNDTYNSRMQRLGVMQSFAVTMDEITNMEPQQMSNQVYDATLGRAKNRLKQHENAERHNSTRWQTGMITTSNRSIIDALLSIKSFPDGEIKRLMEIYMKNVSNSDSTWSRNHFSRLLNNYGHAVEPYCQALVGQLPFVKQSLEDMQLRVDQAASVRNTERYWAGMVSLALAGGMIAKKLNLHDIPIKPVFDYGVNLLISSRHKAQENFFDTDDFLGNFIQQHFHEILVINGNKDARTNLDYAPIREPKGALTMRYEPDTKLLFIMTKAFRERCAKVHVNFDEVLVQYKKSGAYLGAKKKRMTAGTVANTQSAVSAIWFDTTKIDSFNDAPLFTDENNGTAASD